MSYHQKIDFDYLPFKYDQSLITWWSIDSINEFSVEIVNRGLVVDVYLKNNVKITKVGLIDQLIYDRNCIFDCWKINFGYLHFDYGIRMVTRR